jgi:hypothetical protein
MNTVIQFIYFNFYFKEHLQKIDASEFNDFLAASRGEQVRRPRGLHDRRRQARIFQATTTLNRMEYTICEFLEVVSSLFEPVPYIANENQVMF